MRRAVNVPGQELFNAQQQIVAKSTVSTLVPIEAGHLTEFTKQYVGGTIRTLTYPVTMNGEPFSLVHRTNRLGQLVALGTLNQPNRYASFTYHASGQLASEHYQPDTAYNFTRSYRYNSPGFLEQIADPFLTETLAYTEQGYGQAGFGDGMVMQTAFNASWPDTADGRWFQLEESDLAGNYSALCLKALKRTGYLTAHNRPVKLYVREAETALPLVCDKKNLAQQVAQKQLPRYYGHRYAYGNHQELVKAKYFTDETVALIEPLQPDSFSKEIPGLTISQSQRIWQLLTNASYVSADQQRSDAATAIGKRAKSFFRDMELLADLAALNDRYTLYVSPIKKLITSAFSQRRTLSLAHFEAAFLQWQGLDQTSSSLLYNQQRGIAQQIGNRLIAKGYLPTQPATTPLVLDDSFTTILADYSNFIPEIVRVLSQHFSQALGETAFDVESYKIDANGNHHHFYTGFNRYEFTYHNATNQIQSIKLGYDSLLAPAHIFAMQHDAQGNVVQALQSGIQTIEYHPASQRTTHIQLTDGRALRFYYDAQGERVLKRVFTPTGQISHETYYLRDEQGRVLVDQRISYLPSLPAQRITTAYLYGPRGLLGFIRNDHFYSVTTDHAGSIRLVIRNGQVVAAYDYLPYGELMRSYGSDPQAQVMYRYTGQEWDEETGLYNYHARLYDPSIGRFYQPDPKAQYFSPYKYAGNSPVSLIDPDGEEAITLIVLAVIGASVGTYLGGAAANNRWNPTDWDFKNPSTYLGMGGGALAGGFLPIGFAASAATVGIGATIGLGVGGAYLTTAAAHQNWNLLEWEWSRPKTWNGLFQGFGAGSGVFGGIGMAHNFAKAYSITGKTVFLTVSYSVGGGLAYAGGVAANDGNFAFWQWDLSNPATLSALVNGFDSGMGWPQSFLQIGRGVGKLARNPRKLGSLLGKEASKRQALVAILKNPKHPLYKTTASVVMVYFMGSSANGELDITRWNLASFSTYEGILNGVFFGKDASSMFKFAQDANTKTKPSSNEPTLSIKNKINKFMKDLPRLLDNIQGFRKRIECQQLMERSFTVEINWRSKLQQLTDKPATLVQDIENFFKLGLEKWKQGKSNPPEDLKKLLLKQAEKDVQLSSRKLIEWEKESEQLSKKQREIFPDEEAEFLSCSRSARRRKRSGETGSSSFILESFVESWVNYKPTITAKVKLNGGETVDKSLQEVYKYIEKNHHDMMIMTDKQHFLSNHNDITKNGYMLVGYHGTNEISALSIMLNGFKPSTFPYFNPSNFEFSMLDPFTFDYSKPHHWDGVYVAENLELALYYAKDTDGSGGNKHTRVLAVYAKKEDVKNIDITQSDINAQFDRGKPGFGFNKDSASIISGQDTSTNQNEVVIKKDINLKSTVLPIITEDDFKAVGTFLKLQEYARNIIESGRGHLVDNDHVQAMKNILSSDNFSPDDFKSIISHFWTNENGLLKALEYSKSIKNVLKIRDVFHTYDTSVGNAEVKIYKDGTKLEDIVRKEKNTKEIQNILKEAEEYKKIKIPKLSEILDDAKSFLKLSSLSEAGFKEIKNYLTKKNLIDSAEDFKSIREILSGTDFADNQAVKDMKNLLSSPEISNDAFNKVITDILKIKEHIPNNLEDDMPFKFLAEDIPLKHALQYSLGDAADQGAEILYHCSTTRRRKRSIELTKEHESINFLDAQGSHSTNGSINIQYNHLNFIETISYIESAKNQSSYNKKSHTICSSTAAISGSDRLQFWPISLVKNLGSNLAGIGNRLWQGLSSIPHLIQDSNHLTTPITQRPLSKSFDAEPTLLEMGDQWLANTDISGQLLWLDFLVRCYKKYKGKKHQKSQQPTTAHLQSSAEINIQIANILDEFAKVLEESAVACGIDAATTERIIEVMWLQPAVTQDIRQQLAEGRLEAIPARWCELLAKSHQRIALISSEQQATVLLQSMGAQIPECRQRLIEQEWLLGQQGSIALPINGSAERIELPSAACIQQLTQALSTQVQDNKHSQLPKSMPETLRELTTLIIFPTA